MGWWVALALWTGLLEGKLYTVPEEGQERQRSAGIQSMPDSRLQWRCFTFSKKHLLLKKLNNLWNLCTAATGPTSINSYLSKLNRHWCQRLDTAAKTHLCSMAIASLVLSWSRPKVREKRRASSLMPQKAEDERSKLLPSSETISLNSCNTGEQVVRRRRRF